MCAVNRLFTWKYLEVGHSGHIRQLPLGVVPSSGFTCPLTLEGEGSFLFFILLGVLVSLGVRCAHDDPATGCWNVGGGSTWAAGGDDHSSLGGDTGLDVVGMSLCDACDDVAV